MKLNPTAVTLSIEDFPEEIRNLSLGEIPKREILRCISYQNYYLSEKRDFVVKLGNSRKIIHNDPLDTPKSIRELHLFLKAKTRTPYSLTSEIVSVIEDFVNSYGTRKLYRREIQVFVNAIRSNATCKNFSISVIRFMVKTGVLVTTNRRYIEAAV